MCTLCTSTVVFPGWLEIVTQCGCGCCVRRTGVALTGTFPHSFFHICARTSLTAVPIFTAGVQIGGVIVLP